MANYQGKLTGKKIDQMPTDIAALQTKVNLQDASIETLENKVAELDATDSEVVKEVLESLETAAATEITDESVMPVNIAEGGALKAVTVGTLSEHVADKLKDAEYEIVIFSLTKEDGTAVPDIEIGVQVSGESEPRNLTTDENGLARTTIAHGLSYTASYGEIEGYYPLESDTKTASEYSRRIHKTYILESTSNVEEVTLTIAYTGTGTGTVSSVNVIYDDTTHEVGVVDNKAIFEVYHGKTYQIVFNACDGFIKPQTLTYTAALNHRAHTVYYIGAVSGLFWTLRNGDIVEISEWTEELDIVGMRVATSDLISAGCCFTVPLTFLKKETAIYSSSWGTQVDFTCLTNRTNHSQAMNDIDGENMNNLILEECSTRGISCNAVTKARTFSDTINGETKIGFLAAYAQMYILASNTAKITEIMQAVYNITPPQFYSGGWWTASECNSSIAVYVGNGGFNISGKNNSGSIVPLLAY